MLHFYLGFTHFDSCMKIRLYFLFLLTCLFVALVIPSCNRIIVLESFPDYAKAEEYVNDTAFDCSIKWVGTDESEELNQCIIVKGESYKQLGPEGRMDGCGRLYIGKDIHFLFSDGSYFDLEQADVSFWAGLSRVESETILGTSNDKWLVRRFFLSDIYEMSVHP